MAGIANRQKRTVVVVGKTGAGKSTVANILSRDFPNKNFVVKKAYESVTEEVLFTEVEVDVPNPKDGKFTFRIVDTPGFFGTNKKLQNPEVLGQIKKFFQEKSPEGVNLVLFVFSGGSGTRFTQEEREVFDFLTQHLKTEISGASALVLTKCESLDDNGRHDLVQDFMTNDLTRSYADMMGKGIYTVGFPDLKSVRPRLKPIYEETTEKDQEKLINLVVSSSTIFLANEMFKDSFWERLRCTIL